METKVKVGIAAVVGFVAIAVGADTFGGEEPPAYVPPGTSQYQPPPGNGTVHFGGGRYPDSQDRWGNRVENPGLGDSYRPDTGQVVGPNDNYPASN